jgi:hypothetical protein
LTVQDLEDSMICVFMFRPGAGPASHKFKFGAWAHGNLARSKGYPSP